MESTAAFKKMTAKSVLHTELLGVTDQGLWAGTEIHFKLLDSSVDLKTFLVHLIPSQTRPL